MYVTSLFAVLPKDVSMEAIREVETLPRKYKVEPEGAGPDFRAQVKHTTKYAGTDMIQKGTISCIYHQQRLWGKVHTKVKVTVRVRTVMENLEKSWHFKMVISRPGKLMEKP